MLKLLIPTWRRRDELIATLETLAFALADVECKCVISINDGDYELREELLNKNFKIELEVFVQRTLVTYDKQILFLRAKVVQGEYYWFISDKYDYSGISSGELNRALEKRPSALFFGKWFGKSPRSIFDIPSRAGFVSARECRYCDLPASFFPRLTMISAFILLAERHSIDIDMTVVDGGNFAQIHVFFAECDWATQPEAIVYSDFKNKRHGFKEKGRWNEPRGYSELLRINGLYGNFMGSRYTHALATAFGKNGSGFFRMLQSNIAEVEKLRIGAGFIFITLFSPKAMVAFWKYRVRKVVVMFRELLRIVNDAR